MGIKRILRFATYQRSFSTINNLLNSFFRIHTNKHTVSPEKFRHDLTLLNEKLLYYINEYFKLNGNGIGNEDKKNLKKKKIGCLLPPCYSQVVLKFCILLNNFDYLSIPIPIKNSKQLKYKYTFFISENQTDLILCHPFYKNYIEEISFHLQIPFLICYDKPDILTVESYLEDVKGEREKFANKFLYHSSENIEQKNMDNTLPWENSNPKQDEKSELFEKQSITLSDYSSIKNNVATPKEIKKEEKVEVNIILQLMKEIQCDKSASFAISRIWEHSKNVNKIIQLNKTDNALMCIPANKIEYFDVLFSLINNGSTVIFPEKNIKKVLHNVNYMSWFKTHMQNKKDNNFQVHKIIMQNQHFDTSEFAFVDGASLFDEINNCEKDITVLICNNYLVRDFLYFWEHGEINKVTKREFLDKKACKVRKVLINGNEIKPGIDKKYIKEITNIFNNAKIYQRYILQEIGTICITELENIDQDKNVKYQKNTAGYLIPNVNAEIDSETKVLKVKINYTENSACSFDSSRNNKDGKNGTNYEIDEKGFFKTKYVASINENSLLTIKGYYNEIKNIPEEYHLYYKQQRDKMEKMPPGYLKRVRLHGQIWGNFHANKKNWKRKL